MCNFIKDATTFDEDLVELMTFISAELLEYFENKYDAYDEELERHEFAYSYSNYISDFLKYDIQEAKYELREVELLTFDDDAFIIGAGYWQDWKAKELKKAVQKDVLSAVDQYRVKKYRNEIHILNYNKIIRELPYHPRFMEAAFQTIDMESYFAQLGY